MYRLALLLIALGLPAFAGTSITNELKDQRFGIDCTQPDQQSDDEGLNEFVKNKTQYRFEIRQTGQEPFFGIIDIDGKSYWINPTTKVEINVFERDSKNSSPLFTIQGKAGRWGNMSTADGVSENGQEFHLTFFQNVKADPDRVDYSVFQATGQVDGNILKFDCGPYFSTGEVYATYSREQYQFKKIRFECTGGATSDAGKQFRLEMRETSPNWIMNDNYVSTYDRISATGTFSIQAFSLEGSDNQPVLSLSGPAKRVGNVIEIDAKDDLGSSIFVRYTTYSKSGTGRINQEPASFQCGKLQILGG